MFSCEICEIFKKIYFKEHLQTTYSLCSTGLSIVPITQDFRKEHYYLYNKLNTVC